jgi:hypothetical protein
MPCCFKKDQLTSGNKTKMNYFMKCLGDNTKEEKQDKTLGDKLYILQETNKIQPDRYIYLPKYLDIFFNKVWNHDHMIKNHYLIESKSGYYFKYTVKHEHLHFLIALANIYDKTIEQLLESLVTFINKDKNDTIMTYLNNGDIAETFKSRGGLIDYLVYKNNLDFDIIGELASLPGAITPKGIIYYILNKQTSTVKKSLEKEQITEKYYLDCMNPENYYQLDEDRDIIILIKEGKYYFPIYKVTRNEKVNKKIVLQKYFSAKGPESKVIEELRNYHLKSCMNSIVNKISTNINLVAKNIINKLLQSNDKIDIQILKQYIDDRHKCKYLELNNGLFLPVVPSGISYMYPFVSIRTIKNNWLKMSDTIKLLDKIERILKLNYVPKSVIYDKKSGSKIRIISIMLFNDMIVPIQNEEVTEESIKKLALSIRYMALEESINMEIINYNNDNVYDTRGKSVKEHNYNSESYNLFRLELSSYLSKDVKTLEDIIRIVRGNMDNKDKKYELRKILFKITNAKLASEYKVKSSNTDPFVFLSKQLPNLKDYIVSNIRDYCDINKTADKCSKNLHCMWSKDSCKLSLMEDMIINFVNMVIEEMIQDSIKFKEIIQESSYYVSDIVDYTQFTNRPNQKIIKAANFNIKKLMAELFGKDKIPIVGKRQAIKNFGIENEVEEVYPELIELGNQYMQEIIPNKDSIIRAYINSYYWINNMLYDIESRNLGYISDLQTDITYLFKANIIDWVQTREKSNDTIKKYLKTYFKDEHNFFESALNKFRKSSFNTDGIVELYILSHLIDIPIVVYDNYSNVKYIFLQGEIPITPETIKNFTQEKNLNKTIFLKFDYDSSSSIPNKIYSLYYL